MDFIVEFNSVQLLTCVRLFATPWTAEHQASLSITNSGSLLKLMSIELVMSFNHLILCRPLLLLPSIFLSIIVFSNESVLLIRWPKNWSFGFNWVRHDWVTFNFTFMYVLSNYLLCFIRFKKQYEIFCPSENFPSKIRQIHMKTNTKLYQN